MLFALLLATASVADWTPARWFSTDPNSLDLLTGTPVNCLLVSPGAKGFATAAKSRGLAPLALIKPETSAPEALDVAWAGVALEGDFNDAQRAAWRKAAGERPVIELAPRHLIRFNENAQVLGTNEGVWPGVRPEQPNKATHAGPTSAPWIDTNAGFLRFVNAVAPASTFWMANRTPAGTTWPAARYLQAIADAASNSSRWVIDFDSAFAAALLKREPAAVKAWAQMSALLRFYEGHPDWRRSRPHGELAVIIDRDSGALLSGGVLDMIIAKHAPVRPAPAGPLTEAKLAGAKLAVAVEPDSLADPQREALRAFARSGGTLLSGPPGWKMPSAKAGHITLDEADIEKLDVIWREVNNLTGRRNLGARLFNVASMLSNLRTLDDRTVLLHLVNYSDYPVEAITVHLLGKVAGARLLTPEGIDKKLEVYPVEEGTGVEVEKVITSAVLLFEELR